MRFFAILFGAIVMLILIGLLVLFNRLPGAAH